MKKLLLFALLSSSAFAQINTGSGGSGSGTVSGTVNNIGKFTASTTIGNACATDDGTTFAVTCSAGISAPSFTGSGANPFLKLPESTPSGAASGYGVFSADSATHRTMPSNNNGPFSRVLTDDNSIDGTTITFVDDFIGGNGATGPYGLGSWVGRGNGNTPQPQDGVYPNLGLMQIPSGSTAGQVEDIELQNSINPFGNMGGNTNWDAHFIFKLGQTTNTRMYVGFQPQGGTIRTATSAGIWLRFDTNASFGDAAFKVEVCNGTSCTVGSTTYTVDTNYHHLRIRSTTAGQVIFTFDSNADQTLTTNVPTAGLTAAFKIGNDTTASNSSMNVDFFSYKAKVSR